MRRHLTTVALSTLAFALAGCGGDDAAEQVAAPPVSVAATLAPAGSTPTAGRVVVPEALDFSAPLVNGTEFDARGLAGGTVVFWFWSPF
jgi:hypothetical protein